MTRTSAPRGALERPRLELGGRAAPATTSTPAGAGTARLAATSVTSAPRRCASAATSTPIRPGGAVAEEAHRVERLARPARAHEHALAGERLRAREELLAAGGDLLRLAHPPRSDLALCELPRRPGRRARCRARASVSTFARGRRVRPHAGVHRRRDEDGPACASAASTTRLSAIPCASLASVFAEHGATTRRSARSRCGYGILGERPARERDERLARDEALRPGCHERDDVVSGLDEQPRQLARLVGRDGAGDAEKDLGHSGIVPRDPRALPARGATPTP